MISLLLCLCMVFSLLPTAVLAENGEDPDTSAGPGQVMQQNSEDLGDQSDSNDQSDSGDQSDQGDLPDSENSDDSDAPQLLGEGLGSELSGKCGATTEDTVSWALTENEDGYTLTISGNGAMADYYAHYVQREDKFTGDIAPWRRALLSNSEDKRTTDEVVPITKVEIGEGVTRIGSGAFAYTKLTGTVTFSKNVTSYGDGVFARDTLITAVDWTNFKPTVPIRDGWATTYTEEHIAIPYAFFDGCSSLNTSFIDDIEYSGQLVLPDTIKAIYVAAFRGTGFSTVDFSDGLSSIQAVGSYAITGLANMTEFTYPGNVDFYGMSDEGQNNVIQGGGIRKLTIAKEVTELPVSFCTNTENLTVIEFESGSQLTEIGKTAFYNTQALQSIDIPSTVTSIGESAFANCFSLEKIELGQIESLGENTFANCSSLETVKIQGSPNVIYPPNMFSTWGGYDAAPLKTLEIGAGNIRFGLNNQKDSIETIVLGDGVTEIPNHFAAYCTELTSVSLPDALTSVPTYAFNGCSSLKKIGISEKSKLQSIGNGAFANSALTQIYIPKGVTSIGQGAFNITPITVFDMSDVLAESMEVGLYAINNWFDPDASNVPAWKNDFKYIYVSNSGAAASVKDKTGSCNYAFFVTNGGSVDATKTGFAAVYREGYTAKWYDNETCTGNPVAGKPENGKTYYVKWTAGEISGHCGAAGNEQNVRWVLADNGDGYTLSITGTGAMADYTCNITRSDATQPWRESETGVAPTAITRVVVGSGVTNIGEFACDGLSQVKEYNIAASVEDIGPWGVCGQNAVTYTLTGSTHYVVTPDGVLMSADGKTLVSYPGGKDAVDEYVIPETVETILAGAFVGSDAKKVVIPSSVTKFPRFSFGGSTVEEIEFNATVDTLEGGAFSGLSQLKSLVFGGTTLTTIRDQACSDLSSLTEITFPDSLTTIEDQAFKVLPEDGAAAPNLKKVTFGKGMSTIGDVVFLRQSALEVIDMTHCEDLTNVGLFSSRDFDGNETHPYTNTPIVYTADADDAKLVEKKNGNHLIYAVTNGGTFPADTVFETGKLAKPEKEGCLFLDWYKSADFSGEKVTTFEAGQTYYAKWMDHIPEPTNADFANGLVTVKCLNPVACHTMRYGLNAAVAANKYATKQVSATEYSVTYDADAFAVNGHSLYSADTLTWKLTYDGSKWNLAPRTSGIDDVVLVTHAPTTLNEVTKFIDGRTDVIKTSCVNGETATCAYGLMVAFVNKDHVVSVEQEKNSSGEPIPGSYIATLKMDQFVETCAKACNSKSFADSPRTHDVLSKNPVQWKFKVTQAEVSTDAGAEKQYVWSAEPVEEGKDDVCQVAHRVVLTFSYDQSGVKVDDTKVEYKYNTTEITNNVEVPTPTREGYSFVQWLDADGNAFDRTANVTEDHTYNSIEWKPINYRVIFNANAGGKNVTGTMEDQVFTYDQKQTLNANQFVCTDSVFDNRLKKDTQLYEFGGWNTAADGSGTPYTDKADFTNKSVKHGERITLYAQWKHVTKTLTYVSAQGPAPDVADVDIFTEVTVADAPANVEGYTFVGWRSDIDGLRETFKPDDKFVMPNTDVTLTAVWDSETYTITWKNGDATLSETTVKHGETPKYIGETPTREATAEYTYTFSGWTPEPAAATADATYEANFTQAKRSYTVKFYNADGTLLESKQVEYGTVPKLGRTPTLEGNSQYSYTFKTWSPKLAPVTGDAEYCATYTKTVNKYTVTWIVDGASTEETYEYGKMPAHADPVKAATDDTVYTFKGWTPALSIVTGNVTYTAQFDEITKHTVSYELAGGTPAIDSAKYAAGDVVTTPATVPTKTGYVFTGWLASFENKTVNAYGSFTMPNTDVTLTAQWRVAITGNVYIPAMDPEHGTHEEPYSAQLTAKKDNAYGDPVAAGDVQFVLVDANGHADTSRNIGHDLKLNADGSITGTANGAGEVTFRVRLANAAGDFVSDSFEFTIVIDKASRICTSVTMEDWTYGDKPNKPVVTLSKTEGTESYTYFYKVKGTDDSTYTTEVPVNAGDYTVKVVVAESANYKSCEGTADFTIHKALITSVDPVVTAPVACAAAQTTIADGNGYTGTITWTPAPVDGKFDYATEYTAAVVLTPDSNHYFAANTEAEGWSVSYDADSGKLTLTHKFEKTELGKIETPVIRPNGGRFTDRQTVKITCATEGTVIHYTTDGTTPTASSSVYDGVFTITETTTVKAIAVKEKYLDSEVASATFTKYTPRPSTGGATVIPTPSKTELKFNTADHFAYVNGYPDGTVKPAGDVTRAEVAAILYRVMDADCVKTYETTRCSFSDVVRGDWFNTYVATLENAGVIVDTRTNGKFRPNEAITRAELAAMLAQFADIKSAANSFNDVSARHWASDEIAVCAKMGWINGYPDGSFRPDATITRAEMMAMINRALDRTPKSVSDLLSGMKTWSDNANTGAWYYLDVQEATNSHTYTKSGTHETWKKLH